jgi:dolichol-phosphate mannosyltransferase
MTDYQAAKEAGLAAKFAAVGLIGFAVDALLLRIGLSFGLSIAAARLISLICAMQVTFAINGLHVFRCLTRAKCVKQWVGYMTTNGFGNLCNFWIFITLMSLHQPVLSNFWLALGVSSMAAYLINYASARLLVFGAARRGRSAALGSVAKESVCGPPASESEARPDAPIGRRRRVPAPGGW